MSQKTGIYASPGKDSVHTLSGLEPVSLLNDHKDSIRKLPAPQRYVHLPYLDRRMT